MRKIPIAPAGLRNIPCVNMTTKSQGHPKNCNFQSERNLQHSLHIQSQQQSSETQKATEHKAGQKLAFWFCFVLFVERRAGFVLALVPYNYTFSLRGNYKEITNSS